MYKLGSTRAGVVEGFPARSPASTNLGAGYQTAAAASDSVTRLELPRSSLPAGSGRQYRGGGVVGRRRQTFQFVHQWEGALTVFGSWFPAPTRI